MASTTSIRDRSDGPTLLIRHWQPTGDPWAVVLIVHGLAEHSGRYEHVGEQLAAAGLDVHSFDLRGFGRSAGRRAFVDSFGDYHADVADMMVAARAVAQEKPVVLFGHSLGGLIVLGYLLGDGPKPDLVVVSAPAVVDDLPGWKRSLAGLLARLRPTLELSNGLRGEMLCADPEVGRRYLADPDAHHRSTVRLAAAGFHEQARVRAAIGDGAVERLAIPMLVYHGEADPIVPVDASEVLGRQPGVTRRTYPGWRHETHNEPDSTVVGDMVDWLRSKVAERAGTGAGYTIAAN